MRLALRRSCLARRVKGDPPPCPLPPRYQIPHALVPDSTTSSIASSDFVQRPRLTASRPNAPIQVLPNPNRAAMRWSTELAVLCQRVK